ncbi:FAD-dependent oxidoreductase [Fructilactobacillus fructivorans]|uniref:SidA/IucD/PvdA family monooxygenase n=2 Tax=Fructilactobacillus fructivorans TaxID=1614 RepID=A0AAE6P146_9LACO|nr:FAD-dependent oxidoreductase [Fructilactobacillus fructivorans]KRK57496.1 NAD(FAD)-dependent dehydrogenase [Fructilactobacillus fructivorans]KRN42076.1 NAD(FAD)-dependent dehydrogenase [Fructilactobacillus fructivorans]QFX93171.1 SidA/IucD/PvdA family monooxygenase [Fructilactobacillus fructivorans]RDV64787.1 NADH oxidase [Fructilactobacillus fructivorans]
MKIIVVGCTHAGTFAVKQILKEHPDYDLTVYEKNDNISFLSCGIALYLGGEVKDPKGLFYSDPKELKGLGANVQMKHEVTNVDSDKKEITVKDLDSGENKTESYDKLVMTSGSLPIVPPIEGIHNDHVRLCKNWTDAQVLFDDAKDAKHIAVIGAGYIGAELAEAYSKTGHEVTLIDGVDRVLSKYYDPKFTDIVEKDYQDHGVKFEGGQMVQKFTDNGDTVSIKTTSDEFTADLAILCIGFKPNTSLLKGQVEMLPNGAIIVDDYMHSSNKDIYAAGDSAAVHYNPTHKNAYIPLATNAVRQGILVGKNIEKDTEKYMGTQSSSGLKLYDRNLASTGLTMSAAKAQGINAHQVILEDNYRPEFMPTTTPVLMSLVYDPDTRRILGGALTSLYDISQSANVLSVAIQNENTIDDLAMVDMLFQPNFDRPFNYLNLLGQAAQEKEAQSK